MKYLSGFYKYLFNRIHSIIIDEIEKVRKLKFSFFHIEISYELTSTYVIFNEIDTDNFKYILNKPEIIFKTIINLFGMLSEFKEEELQKPYKISIC